MDVDKNFETPGSLAFHFLATICEKGLESACSGSYLVKTAQLSSLLCFRQSFYFVLSSLKRAAVNHKLSHWGKKLCLAITKNDTY